MKTAVFAHQREQDNSRVYVYLDTAALLAHRLMMRALLDRVYMAALVFAIVLDLIYALVPKVKNFKIYLRFYSRIIFLSIIYHLSSY